MQMPFGSKSAKEIFLKWLNQLLDDLPAVETNIDDILVWGTGLTFSRIKCLFRAPEVL